MTAEGNWSKPDALPNEGQQKNEHPKMNLIDFHSDIGKGSQSGTPFSPNTPIDLDNPALAASLAKTIENNVNLNDVSKLLQLEYANGGSNLINDINADFKKGGSNFQLNLDSQLEQHHIPRGSNLMFAPVIDNTLTLMDGDKLVATSETWKTRWF